MKNHQNRRAGFTMVELMIATAVFSTVLLLSLTGFLQIGQLFYKGISSTQTQDAGHRVLESLKNDIVFDATVTQIGVQSSATYSGGGTSVTRQYFCAGSSRYTFTKGQALNTSNETTEMKNVAQNQWHSFGLLKDNVISGSCSDPFAGSGDLNNAAELLNDKMRVSNLTITPLPAPNDKLYNVDVRIAYGDDASLQNPDGPNAACNSALSTSQYCFVTDLKTTVRKGY